ncbi:MAG TPA: hypothetical protein VJY15_14685 [Candidatus Acidoferrum sp.]|nr:hypothetical protein [Candidatus Acidoferrum sp.]
MDTENEKEAKNLAIGKIDPLGMEYSDAFIEDGSRIEVRSVLLVEDEDVLQLGIDNEMTQLYANLSKLN